MNKIMINYFSSIGSLLSFTFSLIYNIIPLAILSGGAFALCLIWFCSIIKEWNDRINQRIEQERAEREWKNSPIDIPLDDMPEVEEVESREIKPGKHPSNVYFKMVQGGGCVRDYRSEDKTAQA